MYGMGMARPAERRASTCAVWACGDDTISARTCARGGVGWAWADAGWRRSRWERKTNPGSRQQLAHACACPLFPMYGRRFRKSPRGHGGTSAEGRGGRRSWRLVHRRAHVLMGARPRGCGDSPCAFSPLCSRPARVHGVTNGYMSKGFTGLVNQQPRCKYFRPFMVYSVRLALSCG